MKNYSMFPSHVRVDEMSKSEGGMTKREFFAAMALQGILSALNGWPDMEHHEETIRRAVKHADTLIIELEKTNE